MRNFICFLCLCIPSSAYAGVFFGSEISGSQPSLPPSLIVHPYKFPRSGGSAVLQVCTTATAEQFHFPLMQAIELWNALAPTQGNCLNCRVGEDPQPATGLVHAASVITHELGHCAFGLGHTNWTMPDGSATSFTNAADNIAVYSAGADGIRGSQDDSPLPLPGTFAIHWFRLADNDPFLIDGTIIDQNTYSRAATLFNLPPGHSWAANANKDVAPLFGAQLDTQSVMYSRIHRSPAGSIHQYTALSADDVNMVKMANTGLDRTMSSADDYSVTLEFVDDCINADIEIDFVMLPVGIKGSCSNPSLAPITVPGETIQHFEMIPANSGNRLVIDLSNLEDWYLGIEVFTDGFESGDTSAWSE